jgi:hypothetical protein
VPGIFISYRREDSAGYAGRLRESLERRLGHGRVFRDVDTLRPGEDFAQAIEARLRDCRAFLAVIGREWLDARDGSGKRRLDQLNDYVRLEIATAVARPGLLVVPVLVEGAAMPTADELPEAMRALARRQAVSLRDESWDEDVDRLVKGIEAVGPPVARALTSYSGWVKRGALAAAALALIVLLARSFGGDRSEPPDTMPAKPARPPQAAESAIRLPRLAEVAHGELIYSLLSGSVSRHGDSQTVRLRVRVSTGRSATNFWDDSFRLAVEGQVFAPTSGLNAVVPAHALQQDVIAFDIPGNTKQAMLRVLSQQEAGEIPLDLSPTGRPAETDRTDTSDASSRAIVTVLSEESKPIVSGTDLSYTLVRATARRFANASRISFDVRVANHGHYPQYVGAEAMRLFIDGQPTAPLQGPNEALPAGAAMRTDFVFSVPPATEHVLLRGVAGQSVGEMPFDLRPGSR